MNPTDAISRTRIREITQHRKLSSSGHSDDRPPRDDNRLIISLQGTKLLPIDIKILTVSILLFVVYLRFVLDIYM